MNTINELIIKNLFDKIEMLQNKVEAMDNDLVDTFNKINENFEMIDTNFYLLEKELGDINESIDEIDETIETINEDLDEINEDLNGIYEDYYVNNRECDNSVPCSSSCTSTSIYNDCECDEEECCGDCFEEECCDEEGEPIECMDCEFNDVCCGNNDCEQPEEEINELDRLLELERLFNQKHKVDKIKDFLDILRSDPEYYQTWQENIAMAYSDNWNWYKKANHCKSKNMNEFDRHKVANDAADYFLKLLLKNSDILNDIE